MNLHGQCISQSELTPKQKSVYIFICNNPESKVSVISQRTEVPRATLRRILKKLIDAKLIARNGRGAGTNYKMLS